MHTIAPLCFLAGAIALALGIAFLVRFIRYQNFPSVPGKLLSGTVTEALVADGEGNGRTYLADISYSYSVGGQRFNSSKVFSLGGSYGHASRSLAQRLCDELAAQRPLAVFYNPAQPDVAFLRNGPIALAVVLPISIGIIFVIIGACLG